MIPWPRNLQNMSFKRNESVPALESSLPVIFKSNHKSQAFLSKMFEIQHNIFIVDMYLVSSYAFQTLIHQPITVFDCGALHWSACMDQKTKTDQMNSSLDSWLVGSTSKCPIAGLFDTSAKSAPLFVVSEEATSFWKNSFLPWGNVLLIGGNTYSPWISKM